MGGHFFVVAVFWKLDECQDEVLRPCGVWFGKVALDVFADGIRLLEIPVSLEKSMVKNLYYDNM
jgi:hypothetical protein